MTSSLFYILSRGSSQVVIHMPCMGSILKVNCNGSIKITHAFYLAFLTSSVTEIE